jgi:hypothetical protein
MIVGHRRQLEAICRQRGYALADVMPCVVEQKGDTWTIDETHAAYPKRRRSAPKAVPQCAAGSHLSKLLRRVGIDYSPGCKCRDMAAKMDANGCDWCESPEGMAKILDAMRTEAAKRGLPFLDAVGRLLVRRAISKESKRAQAEGKAAV